MRFTTIIVLMVLALPLAFASHSESAYTNRDSVLAVDPVVVQPRVVTASESYPYIGPRAVLPSSLTTDPCMESSVVTNSPYYTGRYSEEYYTEEGEPIPRILNSGKPANETNQSNATRGYWGSAPSAYQRLCTKRDYTDYYEPTDGIDQYRYYQRTISKDRGAREEVTISTSPPQRLLEDDPRVRSIGLPDYVDVSEIPWYVAPANPKERPYLFTQVEQDRLIDDQGAYRFIPGNWQDRSYYYLDEHSYALPEDRALRILRAPELMAQRMLTDKSTYSRAQRLLNDEYGEKYGYTITAPSLIEIYEVPNTGIGTVHDGRMYGYIRNSENRLSRRINYDVDPRLVQDLDDAGEAYRESYYDVLDVNAPVADDPDVISPEGTAFRRYPRLSSLAYYQQKLEFINARQQYITRRATRAPVSYDHVQTTISATGAQRILEQPEPSAQRILGYEPSTAQRTLS